MWLSHRLPTWPLSSSWLLVNFNLSKDTTCFIHWAPVAGESGCTCMRGGEMGSALPATTQLELKTQRHSLTASLTLQLLYFRWKSLQCPLNGRLSGPQNWSGHSGGDDKNSCPAEIEPRSLLFVVHAIERHMKQVRLTYGRRNDIVCRPLARSPSSTCSPPVGPAHITSLGKSGTFVWKGQSSSQLWNQVCGTLHLCPVSRDTVRIS